MPRLNGTGPNGNGAKTGRGLGQCSEALQNQNTTTTITQSNLMNNEEQRRYHLCRNDLRRSDMQSSGMRRCGKGSGSRRRLKGN
ncbi:DUF5320 domain-containing protein [Fusibacter bizertensis]